MQIIFSLSHVCVYTHKKVCKLFFISVLDVKFLIFIGKAEAWGMKQLSLTFGAQVQIYFCTTLDFILVLGAVLAWGSLKERTFQKAGDGWRWKVGWGINRSHAFSLYLNHVQLLMPTSDSKDPGQVWVFLSWPCLSGEAQPCLSFPHLTISGEQQLWDSGYYSAFSSGAIVLPGEQCFAAATWRDWTSTVDSVLRLPSPWTIHAADSVRRGTARLGCTAILLYVMRQIFTKMDCSPVCMVRTESWGPWCPFSSWQEGGLGQRSSERGVLDLAVSLLLSLWTHPVTWLRFPQQNEDTDSAVFQEVLLRLWNVLYDWLAISKGLARSLQHLGTI